MVLAVAGFATVSAISALSAVPAALAIFALLLGERLFGRTISIRAAIIFAFVFALAIWSSGFFFFSSGMKGNSALLGFCLSLVPLFFILDLDNQKSPREIESYKRIAPRPACSILSLLRAVDTGSSVIVSYLEKGGVGHFSPLAGGRQNKLILP